MYLRRLVNATECFWPVVAPLWLSPKLYPDIVRAFIQNKAKQ